MNDKVLKTLEYDKIIEKLTDCAGSDPGRELCRSLVPMTVPADITLAQMNTTDAAARIRMKGSLSFGGVRDIRPYLIRLSVGSSLTAPELLSIGSLLDAAARAKSYGCREVSDEIPDDSLDALFRLLAPIPALAGEISRCILSEEEIADSASPGLARVRRSMSLIGSRVHTQLNSILNANRSYLQDAVITMRNGRYCLPVRAEYKGQIDGMIHDQSASGSTLFIEPLAIIQLNNELSALEVKEKKEIDAVLASLSSMAAPHAGELEEDFRLLSRLDFIFAKAAFSRQINGSQPVFNTRGEIHIKEGRHPLLDPSRVVPTNVWLGKDFNLLVVTGPNTGGKTVSLKTVGLFSLMGQAGLHIPAFDGSELAVFTEIFADIGDEQSIEQNLSTFSAHMTHVVEILNRADSGSLCLFDELGAGTDPTEGAALAASILSFLHNLDCRTMATTHYSELKVFALSTPGVENASCEFDVATLMPTYRLLIGVPGKSNAFAISRKLGLPDYIIDDARGRIEAKDASLEDVISRLEESRLLVEKEEAEIKADRAEIERLQKSLAAREARLEAQREQKVQSANEEAQRILREAKETADRTIKNINKLASSAGVNARALEAERAKLRDSLKQADSRAGIKKERRTGRPVSTKTIKPGDAVRVLTLNLDGTVCSAPDSQGSLMVQMGVLRSRVNIRDLALIEESTVSGPGLTGKPQRTGGSGSAVRMDKSATVSAEINLIGLTVDEATARLDKYLDDALIAHLGQIRIVHGKGTGALRAGVHRHLKKLSYVQEFRLGEPAEGGAGVTIVTL